MGECLRHRGHKIFIEILDALPAGLIELAIDEILDPLRDVVHIVRDAVIDLRTDRAPQEGQDLEG